MAPWGGPPVRASENWRGDVVGQKGQTTKNSTQFFLSIIMKYNFLLFAMFIFLVPACQNVVPDVICVDLAVSAYHQADLIIKLA